MVAYLMEMNCWKRSLITIKFVSLKLLYEKGNHVGSAILSVKQSLLRPKLIGLQGWYFTVVLYKHWIWFSCHRDFKLRLRRDTELFTDDFSADAYFDPAKVVAGDVEGTWKLCVISVWRTSLHML